MKNLTPVKPGQVLNPNGRPKGSKNRSTIFKEMLEQLAPEKLKKLSGVEHSGLEGKTVLEVLVAAQIMKASTGDTQAFKEVADSTFGKVTDKVETKHSFTKMGRITAQPVAPLPSDGGAPQPVGAPVELTFDVGVPVHEDPEAEEEGSEDDTA